MFLVSDVNKMRAESLCYGIFGLSYILLFASLACDAVHHIWALASDVVLAGVNRGCGGAFKSVHQ